MLSLGTKLGYLWLESQRGLHHMCGICPVMHIYAHIIIVMFKSGDPEKTRGFKSVFEEVMRRTFSLHPDALA